MLQQDQNPICTIHYTHNMIYASVRTQYSVDYVFRILGLTILFLKDEFYQLLCCLVLVSLNDFLYIYVTSEALIMTEALLVE